MAYGEDGCHQLTADDMVDQEYNLAQWRKWRASVTLENGEAQCEVCDEMFDPNDGVVLDGRGMCSDDCYADALDMDNCAREEDRQNFPEDEDGTLPDGSRFADPGGNSSLRAETASNPRNLPCPTCGAENVLTPADRACGYQCNRCADMAEGLIQE